MSSFAGISFKVIPQDGWFPVAAYDDDGIPRYQCTALITSQTALQNLRNRLGFATVKRGRGSLAFTVHIEAGSPASLTIPLRGGVSVSYQALLVRMSNVQGYGGARKNQFTAELEFIIVGKL